MAASDTERSEYVIYKNAYCRFLGQATVFGKVYYDILVNGIRKTVPASECRTEITKEKES